MSDYVETFDHLSFDVKKPNTLRHLDIELTERCNNDCIHCYINKPAASQSNEMDTEFIKRLIRHAAALGCVTIRFTGGEPLLRSDFPEIYEFTRRQGIRVILFTNATLLNDELIDLFKRIPPRQPIEVTLYGMHASSYEAITRKPNTFQSAWAGIQLLWQNNIPFMVKQAYLPPNYQERREFEAWAETIPWMRRPADYVLNYDLRVRRDSEIRNDMIRSIRMTPEHYIQIMARHPQRYLDEMKQFMTKFSGIRGTRLFTCGAGRSSWTVDSFGNLQVCLMVRHPNLVISLYDHSLKQAMTLLTDRRDESYASRTDYQERCARCFLYDRCRQCPGTAWCEHGVMDQPVDYYCSLTHAEARYFNLLGPDEYAWDVDDWKQRIQKFAGSTDK